MGSSVFDLFLAFKITIMLLATLYATAKVFDSIHSNDEVAAGLKEKSIVGKAYTAYVTQYQPAT